MKTYNAIKRIFENGKKLSEERFEISESAMLEIMSTYTAIDIAVGRIYYKVIGAVKTEQYRFY